MYTERNIVTTTYGRVLWSSLESSNNIFIHISTFEVKLLMYFLPEAFTYHRHQQAVDLGFIMQAILLYGGLTATYLYFCLYSYSHV